MGDKYLRLEEERPDRLPSLFTRHLWFRVPGGLYGTRVYTPSVPKNYDEKDLHAARRQSASLSAGCGRRVIPSNLPPP